MDRSTQSTQVVHNLLILLMLVMDNQLPTSIEVGPTFWFTDISLLQKWGFSPQQSRVIKEQELYVYNRWLQYLEYKLPLEEYKCFTDDNKMVEALKLLGYSVIYLVDVDGNVLWYERII